MARVSVRSCAALASRVACLFLLAAAQAMRSEPQGSSHPPAEPHGIVSRQPLKPPIRGLTSRVQFSPDGNYLLLQSDSGLFLFSTRPLKPILHIDADYLYPVRFAADSQSLAGVSFALRTARWKIPRGEIISTGEVPAKDGCISGALSPNGESFVCRNVDLGLLIYDLNSRSELFMQESPFRFPLSVTVPVSLPPENIIAAPFGLASARSFQVFANEGVYPGKFAFSPDAALVGVWSRDGNSLWNLRTKHKVNLPGVLNRYSGAGFCFLDADRVLITGAPGHSEIVSLATGKVLDKLKLEVSAATLASNPRYVVLEETGTAATRLYDLVEDRIVPVPFNSAIDIREDVLALLDPSGQLCLYQIGQSTPFASALVPLESSPRRFSVAASPNLDRLAFGFGRETGLYRVDTGERTLVLDYSWQLSVSDSAAYFTRPSDDGKSTEVLLGNPQAASASYVWKSDATFLRATPSVFLEYELQGPKQHVPEVLPDGKIPFTLTARTAAAGGERWKKKFISSHPVPFVDPQGKNLVLGWEANTEAARAAAKRCPEAWPAFEKTKATRNDTFFEVLSAATGETLGGVLVRTGSGPLSFDSVAAIGNMLIVAKAEGRITLYSLDDGDIKAHLSGTLPAASEKSHLLALVESDSRLGIYDLQTGRKLDTQHFAQAITYAHFADDGRRILVLTRQQVVYVLDVSAAANSVTKR